MIRERLRKGFRCDASVRAWQQSKLRPTGEEGRGTAFVGLDVGVAMREHGSIRRAERGETQGVRRGAGRDRKGAHFGAKVIAEAAIEARRPLVIAVAVDPAVINRRQRRQDLRAGGRGVVAEKCTRATPERS